MVGQAATGTGKTAAFALPLLQRLAAGGDEHGPDPRAMVLVPTRELAMQVAEAVHRYGRAYGVGVLPIYGGQSFGQQLKVLKRGVDVAVATPGRALDHMRRGTLRLDALEVVVLDEADEMLDMGFAEDLEAILQATPTQRQTVLFSATLPQRITSIAKRYLRDPVRIHIASERAVSGSSPQVRQSAYLVLRAQKVTALGRILDVESPEAAIVFCRTRTEVDELTETLNGHGYRAEALHGGMSQEQRDRVMKKLRGGAADLLIATDVAARGLDISRLSHVINFDVPNAPDSYIHRIGRVGRAGREGVAITLAEPREHRLLRNIEQLIKAKIEISRVPTVADLRARRLQVVRDGLREVLLEGDFDRFRAVVESLADEFDPMEIAMAAVKLSQSAGDEAERDEQDILEPPRIEEKPGSGKRHPSERGSAIAQKRGAARRSAVGDTVRIFIGAGRSAGIRPQDLVGAITGEAGIAGREVGSIELADHFSIVEVPASLADDVVKALRGSTIRGKKVTVRVDRAEGRAKARRK